MLVKYCNSCTECFARNCGTAQKLKTHADSIKSELVPCGQVDLDCPIAGTRRVWMFLLPCQCLPSYRPACPSAEDANAHEKRDGYNCIFHFGRCNRSQGRELRNLKWPTR